MKTIDILVEDLPKRGGWPNDSDKMRQSQLDCEIYTNSKLLPDFYVGERAEDNGNGVTREQYEAALAAKNEGWIEWGGGECPVQEGVLVKVKYRNEKDNHIKGTNCAGRWSWEHCGTDGDIIAYRLHKPDINSRANDDRLEQDLNECIGQGVDMPEWNGDGLPAVGCECEAIHRSSDAWQQIIVVAVNGGAVFGFWAARGTPCALPIEVYQFRPLRTEAERKRDKAIEEIIKIATIYTTKSLSLDLALNSIYNAIAAGEITGVKLED